MQVTLFVPTVEDVAAVKVGTVVTDSFGRESRVVEVSYRGTDIFGHKFVGFYTAFGENNGSLSGSLKAGELLRDVHTSRFFTSAELDRIEAEMLKAGERIRVVEVA